MSQLHLSREEFVKRYQAGVAKGVVLVATAPNQTAADAQINGFYAGAFTYNLTQYLWQQTSTPERVIAYVIPWLIAKVHLSGLQALFSLHLVDTKPCSVCI